MKKTSVFLEGVLWLKLCWNRANSHFAIPFSILEKAALGAILLKIYGIDNMTAVYAFGVLLIGLMLFVGYVDIFYGVFGLEQSLSNRYNPELQRLLRKRR